MLIKKRMIALMLLSSYISLEATSKDLIKSVVITKNKMKILVNDEFKSRFLKDDFFIEYDEDIDLEKLNYSLVTMPFLMIVLSAVWVSGENYFVDEMDRDLFHSLKKIKKVVKTFYPKTPWKGNIIPRRVVSNSMPMRLDEKEHMALLYSGGLDSTVSSFFHKDKKQLLITAWGQWDLPLNKPELWNTIRDRLQKFAEDNGHTSSFIKSNYSEFFNHEKLKSISPEINAWRLLTIEDIGWAGLVAPILYQKGYTLLRIASGDTYNYAYPTAANPLIDNNICYAGCYAGIRLEHDMYTYKRLDKIEYLASLKHTKIVENPWLYVCQTRADSNCCKCAKCIATIMGFIALGEDPRDYSFDVSPEEGIQRTKRHLNNRIKHNKLSYTAVDRFSDIQDTIKTRIARGEASAENFDWFLELDFKQLAKHTDEAKFQKKMDWKELHILFPDIPVPDQYLSNNKKHLLDKIKSFIWRT